MLKILRFSLFPFSLLYGGITFFRNLLFDLGLLKSYRSALKVISIGNLSTGGTGKTPFTEMLLDQLGEKHEMAVLSRGYGRSTLGFKEVEVTSIASEVGDESLQIKVGHPDVLVVVCENRKEGLRQIEQNHPSVNLVLLDDAYQHRYVERDLNILLTDFKRPFFKDFMLPTGNLREWSRGKNRADLMVVTKTPADLSNNVKQVYHQKMGPASSQKVAFAFNDYGTPIDLFTGEKRTLESNKKILVLSGIARGTDFFKHVSNQVETAIHLNLKDHVVYTEALIQQIKEQCASLGSEEDVVVVTTAKDGVKLKAFRDFLGDLSILVLPYALVLENEKDLLPWIETKIIA